MDRNALGTAANQIGSGLYRGLCPCRCYWVPKKKVEAGHDQTASGHSVQAVIAAIPWWKMSVADGISNLNPAYEAAHENAQRQFSRQLSR
jgi:hypothetical protein